MELEGQSWNGFGEKTGKIESHKEVNAKENGMRRIMKLSIGILILASGIMIFFYPDYKVWKTQKEIRMIVEKFQEEDEPGGTQQETELTEDRIPKEDGSGEMEGEVAGSLELFTALQEYNKNLAAGEQVITDAWNFTQLPADIDALNEGTSAVGYIEIPDISVSLPLYIGATEENMSEGAVVLTGTSMPIGGNSTNCVVAAHRGWKGSPYFRDIDQLEVGSEILIRNLWEELVYQVAGTEIIPASECSILDIRQGQDMVTLFSCYPYMSPGTKYRLVVYCERKEKGETEEQETANQYEGITVRELAEKELAEEGIAIDGNYGEGISQKEDLLRIILPAACIVAALLFLLFYRKGRG